MGVFEFTVHSEPKPQPRPRAQRIGNGVRIYTPQTSHRFKAAIGLAAWEALKKSEDISVPIDGAVCLETEFVLRRPKRLKKTELGVPHTSKPDLDNLTKSLADACVDCGLLKDDCLVHQMMCRKRYANPDEPPHCRIVITFD